MTSPYGNCFWCGTVDFHHIACVVDVLLDESPEERQRRICDEYWRARDIAWSMLFPWGEDSRAEAATRAQKTAAILSRWERFSRGLTE